MEFRCQERIPLSRSGRLQEPVRQDGAQQLHRHTHCSTPLTLVLPAIFSHMHDLRILSVRFSLDACLSRGLSVIQHLISPRGNDNGMVWIGERPGCIGTETGAATLLNLCYIDTDPIRRTDEEKKIATSVISHGAFSTPTVTGLSWIRGSAKRRRRSDLLTRFGQASLSMVPVTPAKPLAPHVTIYRPPTRPVA
jgi:hypothetical protein